MNWRRKKKKAPQFKISTKSLDAVARKHGGYLIYKLPSKFDSYPSKKQIIGMIHNQLIESVPAALDGDCFHFVLDNSLPTTLRKKVFVWNYELPRPGNTWWHCSDLLPQSLLLLGIISFRLIKRYLYSL